MSIIVRDEFINDELLLEQVADSQEFKIPRQWGWWAGWWREPARCLRERVLEHIWKEYSPMPELANSDVALAGFEYWTLAHQAKSHESEVMGQTQLTSRLRDRLLPHRDRDEVMFSSTGKCQHPHIGIVYYPIVHNVEGGLLKIYVEDRFDGPFETVSPRSNRLVVFNSALLHEVTPVINGLRYAMASNAWEYPIEHPKITGA